MLSRALRSVFPLLWPEVKRRRRPVPPVFLLAGSQLWIPNHQLGEHWNSRPFDQARKWSYPVVSSVIASPAASTTTHAFPSPILPSRVSGNANSRERASIFGLLDLDAVKQSS